MPPAKGLGLLVHDVARLLRRRIDQKAQSIGLTSAQWRVLSAIARAEFRNEEAPKQAGIAEEMDLEPITLSRLVDRMETAGLIERRPDPNDRRAHRLFLKDAARPLVSSFREVATECINTALAGVSNREVEEVVAILTRVRANLSGKPETATMPDAELQTLPPKKRQIS
ncbi:MAG TPA: MarR family transcriptional regulator [Bauldia sp.]|nr:MarR family transcriptional regulator [Bauldia sp.]